MYKEGMLGICYALREVRTNKTSYVKANPDWKDVEISINVRGGMSVEDRKSKPQETGNISEAVTTMVAGEVERVDPELPHTDVITRRITGEEIQNQTTGNISEAVTAVVAGEVERVDLELPHTDIIIGRIPGEEIQNQTTAE
jgi:hypothetical protein